MTLEFLLGVACGFWGCVFILASTGIIRIAGL